MEIEKRRIRLFVYICLVFPLVDVLNGSFIYYGISIPVGVIYRLSFLLLLFVFILLKGLDEDLFSLYFIISMVVIIIVFSLQALYFRYSSSLIIAELSALMKVLMWIFVAYFIRLYRKSFTSKMIEDLLLMINVNFVIGLLVPYFLKIGATTYDNEFVGFKGFYVGPNDTAFAFSVVTIFLAWYLSRKISDLPMQQKMALLLLLMLDMYCLLLLATKTALICSGMTILYFILELFLAKKEKNLIFEFFSIQILLLSTIALLLKGKELFVRFFLPVYRRYEYFYYQYHGDLLRLFSSSRSLYLEASIQEFVTRPNNVWVFLLGYGFENRILMLGRMGLIEMDFFDILFSYGILGLVLIVGHLIFYFNVALKYKSINIYTFLFCYGLIFGFFAGHVLYSALSSTLLGIICGGLVILLQEKKVEESSQEGAKKAWRELYL